jgi:hypothetical protein
MRLTNGAAIDASERSPTDVAHRPAGGRAQQLGGECRSLDRRTPERPGPTVLAVLALLFVATFNVHAITNRDNTA